MNKKKNLRIRAKSIQKKPFYWAFHQVSFLMAFFSLPPFSHFFSRFFFEILRASKITITFLSFFVVVVKWSNNDKLYRALVTKRYSQHNESIFYKWQSVAAKKKYCPPYPPKNHQLLPQNYSLKKPTAIYNMTNEIKEKEKIMMKWKMIKRKNKKQKEASSTTFK